MLRYLLKTLLQMNLFADSLAAEASNSSELLLGLNGTFAALDLRNLSAPDGSGPHPEDAPPRIVEHPADLLVSRGEAATLRCRAEGRPAPAVRWYRDGERVPTASEEPRSHRTLLPGGSLFFARVLHGRRGKADEGVYVCVATNYLGEATSRNASLEVAVLRDDFRQAPSDVAVTAGEPAVLECVPPRGHPEPSVSWKKNGVRLSDEDRRLAIRGGKLMVASVRKSDAGAYVCVAANAAGERDSEPAELVVLERPVFSKRPLGRAVLAEATAEFACEARGDPPPAVRWRKDDGELPPGSILAAYNILAACAAAERLPPVIRRGPGNQTLPAAATARLPCRAAGNPLPTVRWLKDGQALVGAEPRATLLENGTLQITGLRVSDSGQYVCVAASSAGETRWSGALRVQEGEQWAPAVAGPSPVPGVLPAPPSAPRVTGVTESTVALAWDGGWQSGAAAATSYVIEAFSQSSGGAWRTVAADVKAPAHTVSGLEPGAVYLFLVRAANAFGLSDPSAVSEPVRTRRPPGASPELARVAVRLQEPLVLPPGAVRLTWTVDGPAALLRGYRVLYRRRGTGSAWEARDVAGAGQRGALLTELRPGQEYEIKVRPVPEGPRGAESAVRAVRTPEAAPSAPPRAVRVAPLGDGIAISWEPPPAGEQNGVIQDYRIWCLGNESRFDLNASAGAGKAVGKAVQPPALSWPELLPPPPSASELSQYEEEEEDEELASSSGLEDWCPPLPERGYAAGDAAGDTTEEGSPPATPSPAGSCGRQSTATLTPSPRAERRAADRIPRLRDFDGRRLPRAITIQQCHRGLAVPLSSGCAIAIQLCRPDLAMPLSSSCAIATQPCHHDLAVLWQSGHAVAIQLCYRDPAVPSQSGLAAPGTREMLVWPWPAAGSRFALLPLLLPFARRPPNGASTLPRALSPGTGTEDGAESPAPRARRDPGHDGGCSPGLGERRGCATASISAALVPKSRPKPKSGRYRRDQQPADVVPYGKPTFLTSSRGSTGSRGHGSGRSRTPGDRGEEMR
ncbi:roundabout homolog 3-like [Apteryx rowi]|uniref:roundabout homolog 3-like n=1 Tax=Apteryx rowi TaxID=308060 RepID=UPI000E1D0B38|nr:roundabout homolog 3-like [Apteryx rowi]